MAILFEESKNQFYLHTKHTSYVMELYNGCLAHVHWGGRADSVPSLDELFPFGYGADFFATDLPGRRFSSTDKLPQEYPTTAVPTCGTPRCMCVMPVETPSPGCVMRATGSFPASPA